VFGIIRKKFKSQKISEENLSKIVLQRLFEDHSFSFGLISGSFGDCCSSGAGQSGRTIVGDCVRRRRWHASEAFRQPTGGL